MTRSPSLYRDGGAGTAPAGSYEADTPRSGFYRFRFVAGAHPVGVEMRFGPPLDPDTGEEMDRSPRWMCFVNGIYFDEIERVWPQCGGDPISQADHDHLKALQVWGEVNDPKGAQANPRRRVDLLTAALPF